MKDFWKKFSYLLDKQDQKNFIKFVLLLFAGGLLSLFGIGVIIPFVSLLIDPSSIERLPIIKHISLNYHMLLGGVIFLLIISFWAKNISAFIILKKQAAFLGSLVAKIQKRLFMGYLSSPYTEHIKRHSHEMINNMNVEIGILSNSVIAQFGTLLNEGITSCIIALALLIINPIFSLVVVFSILLTALIFMQKLRHKITYYGEMRSLNDAKLTQNVLQSLGGIKETKLYQKEFFFIKRINEFADVIAFSDRFAVVFQQTPRFLIETILITVVLTLLFVFLQLGYTASQMLVLISVFGIAAVQLLPSMNRLMQAIANIKYGYVALDKIYAELFRFNRCKLSLPSPAQVSDRSPRAFQHIIELKHVYFEYENTIILHDINLSIEKGRKVAFVGASGSGKTTLVNIILGILQPSKGERLVDGQPIEVSDLPNWYPHFGYIPESIYIYNTSIKENVAFGVDPSDINEDQVRQCLKIASLDEFVETKEAGLDFLLGENGINLSAGQRQRIGIARALYHQPTILVMDEATAALDNQTEQAVTASLAKAAEGRTTITIAHRLSTIHDYDVIYVLQDGRIVGSGNYADLSSKCLAFQQIAGFKY